MEQLSELQCLAREVSLSKRLLIGIGSSALGQAVAALQTVMLIPLFLRAWGSDGYGRWVTLTAFVSYLNLLDLGGQNYIGNLLAHCHAQGDVAAFRKRLSEGVSLFVLIGAAAFAALLLILVVCSRLPVPGLLRPLAPRETWILALLGTNFLLGIPGGVYVTAYRSSGRFTRGGMIGNALRFSAIGLSVVLLFVPVTATVYAASILCTGIAGTLVIIWDTRRCIPGCSGLELNLAEARQGWPHLRGAFYFWLIALSQAAIQQGLILILARASSPSKVAAYSTHRALSSVAGFIGILVLGPLWPELSFLWAQNRYDELRRTSLFAIRIVVFATGLVAILIWITAPFVYSSWTSHRLEVQTSLLGLLLLQATVSAGWSTSSWSLLATNRHRAVALASLANAVVTITLATQLARSHGALGIAIASLIGDFTCGLAVFPSLSSSFFRIPPARVYYQFGFVALALVPFAAAAVLANTLLQGWRAITVLLILMLAAAYPVSRFVVSWERI